MRYSKRTVLIGLVALVIGVTGCGDSFLTRPPEAELTSDNFYNSAQDLEMATAALYNQVWFDWNDKASFVIGDSRAGNMWSTDDGYQQFAEFSITRENPRLNESWRSLYLAVNQSNLVIQNIRNNISDDIPEEARQEALAEARFIRGYAYSYLGQLWGPVPIVTNTPRLIDQPDRRRNRLADVFQFAINDFEFAAEHLPPTQDQPGRVTEWSAKGMLARMHWTRALYRADGGGIGAVDAEDLQAAQDYAGEVINQSGMSLRDNFGELFLLSEEEQNNQQESLFSLQWTYEGDTWGTQNTVQSYLAPSSELTGFADGWGGGTGVQAFMIETFNAPNSGDDRRPETFMMAGDYYSELLQEEGGYTYEAAGADSYTGDATAIKKYVIGRPSDNDGRVAQQRTGIDTYMLRLAEVYLMYAQTFVLQDGGSTSNSEALEYYDRVRERAGLQGDQDGTLTQDEVFMEKWRELAFEGQCWFMLVRRHYYEPEVAKQFIRDQERNRSVSYDESGNVTIEDDPANLEVTDAVFRLQYPEQDVLQNDLLLDDPVEYDFSEQGSDSE
jgi:hypothetical protein